MAQKQVRILCRFNFQGYSILNLLLKTYFYKNLKF